jgi:hypothetical protein
MIFLNILKNPIYKPNQIPMQSDKSPTVTKPGFRHFRRYRRVKVWKVQSSIGEFCIYAVDAKAVREEFKRLKPTATIINIIRNS